MKKENFYYLTLVCATVSLLLLQSTLVFGQHGDSISLKSLNPQIFNSKETTTTLDFDYNTAAEDSYELHFVLDNDSNISQTWYLFTGENQIVELYYDDIKVKAGKYTPTKERLKTEEFYFIPLTINANKKVKLKLVIKNALGLLGKRSWLSQSHSAPNWKNINLYSEIGYLKKKQAIEAPDREMLGLLYVFLGAMGFTALFVLLLYLLNRQRVFLHYSCYLFAYFIFGVFHTRHYTYIGSYLGNFPVFQQLFPETLIWVGMFFYGYFSINLLGINSENYPKIRRYLVFISWLSLISGILIGIVNLASNNLLWNLKMVQWIRMIYSPLGFVGIVLLVWKVRSPLTWFLALGVTIWAILGNYSSTFAIGMPYQLTAVGLGNNPAIFWLCIGLLLESVMFSFALGMKIRISEKERLENKETLIQKLNEIQKLKEEENVRLEEMVDSQTKELLAANSKVEEQKKREIKQGYEKRLALSEMNALRSQMNPHFIFNSLNSIKHLILSDQKQKSSTYLNKFAKLLRQILVFSRKNQVSLKEELENIQIYLELESERFGDSFEFRINTDSLTEFELEETEVPPLILQPFVENSIIHGFKNSESDKKVLKITANVLDERILIEIEDNGIGRAAAEKFKSSQQKSFGTTITNERIQLFNETYGSTINLNYTDLENGTLVKLYI